MTHEDNTIDYSSREATSIVSVSTLFSCCFHLKRNALRLAPSFQRLYMGVPVSQLFKPVRCMDL